MDEFRLVRGFSSLDAAAAAVNALVQGGIEHGATGLHAAGGLYLVIVEATSPEEYAYAERLLSGSDNDPVGPVSRKGAAGLPRH